MKFIKIILFFIFFISGNAIGANNNQTKSNDINFSSDKLKVDENTKIIVHGAKIAQGSSGGPLFDKDGRLIGLNTLAAPGTAAENITVSADHIKELLGK